MNLGNSIKDDNLKLIESYSGLALIVFNSERYRTAVIVIFLSLVALVMQVAIISLKSLLVLNPDTFLLIYLPPIVVLVVILLVINVL